MMVFLNDFFYILPEIFLLSTALLYLFVGIIYVREEKALNKFPRLVNSLFISFLFILFFTFILVVLIPANYSIFNNMLVSTEYVKIAKLVLLVLAASVAFIFHDVSYQERTQSFEQFVLFLFSIIALFILMAAQDFLVFYLALELQSLLTYVLAASRREYILSVEAGLKYFVLGSLASGMLLFGLALIYGLCGTTNIASLGLLLLDVEQTGILVAAFSLVLGAIFFKLAAAPFHSWAPDVYEGSPFMITAFFAVIPKMSFVVFVIRVLQTAVGVPFGFSALIYVEYVFLLSGILSLFIGVLGALYQTRIKRLIAYSSIANVGYILCALFSGTAFGIQAAFFYVLVYGFLVLNLFLILTALRKTTGETVHTLSQLRTVSRANPYLAIFLAANMFSLAGIPPLAGFFSKLFLLKALLEADLIYVAILVVFLSVIAAVYYIRVVRFLYFDKTSFVNYKPVESLPLSYTLTLSFMINVAFIFVVDLFFYFSASL